MNHYQMGEKELFFAKLIWKHEPISSGELVKLCEKELHWKKSTTYTVLKKLCTANYFKNENSVVSSLISYDGYLSIQSRSFVKKIFDDSLPCFLTAFIGKSKLSDRDIAELKQLIEEYEVKD